MDWALWIKSVHVIAVISWMAGMLYLPRLFVYHAQSEPGSELSETLKIMERRLLRMIINPAMIVAWIAGLTTVYLQGQYMDIWFHIKLVLVLIMSGMHGSLSKYRRELEQDSRERTARFFRIINEVPTVLMVFIVFIVILKPF